MLLGPVSLMSFCTAQNAKMLDTQKCLQNHVKIAKITKFLLHSALYTPKRSTCKVSSFYNFWFKFYDKFCSPGCRPYSIVHFLRISDQLNREGNLNTKFRNSLINACGSLRGFAACLVSPHTTLVQYCGG